MDDDVRTQLVELQRSVDTIAGEVKDIREEQTRASDSHKILHQEHGKLVDRIETHERRLEVHVNDYSRQAEHNELIHAHMTGTTLSLREELQEFRGEFKEHARVDEEDRKDQLAAQIATNNSLRTTFATVLISGGGLFLALLGILVTLWIHASKVAG